jgi:putative aldouronate transport system permease protein
LNTLKSHRNKYWDLYLMMIPGIAYFFIFKYIPMFGMVIAFQNYSPFAGIRGSEWVGWQHFAALFQDPVFFQLFENTLLISIYKLFWGFPAPILLALLLNEIRLSAFKRSIQTLVYLPHFLSWVIIGGMLTTLLSPSTGVANDMIRWLGFEPIFFLTDTNWFRSILVASNIWKEAGWGAILYLAALSGINPELYEAAFVDGANKWRQTWSITLPSIMGTVVILFLLRLGNLLEVGFEQIFILYNPLVYDISDVFDTYVYRVGIAKAEFSYPAAIGLFQSVIGLILVVGANKLSKKYTEHGIW